MMVSIAHSPERLPQALADELDSVLKIFEHDAEVCRTLRTAREQLRVLSWNRFKARHEHVDKAVRIRRRHQGHGHQALYFGRTAIAYVPSPNRVRDHA
jgi:hypothetical protein